MAIPHVAEGTAATYGKDWTLQVTGLSFGRDSLLRTWSQFQSGQSILVEMQSGIVELTEPNIDRCAVATSWKIWSDPKDAQKANAVSLYEFPHPK
jgi:hypothetical protein